MSLKEFVSNVMFITSVVFVGVFIVLTFPVWILPYLVYTIIKSYKNK